MNKKIPAFKLISGGIAAVILLLAVTMAGSLVEVLQANDMAVIQSMRGKLDVWTEPGPHAQLLGRVTTFAKSSQFWFSADPSQGNGKDESLKIIFNDGGKALLSGSVRFDLPMDKEKMLLLHQKYGTQDRIISELIKPAMEKAVYLSGPLMSSKESYAERRSQLMTYIEDQLLDGIYLTRTKTAVVEDEITGEKKNVTITELVPDSESPNGLKRQAESAIKPFGIKMSLFAINNIEYEDRVKEQIAQQQKITMGVQTAIANAKAAEQDRLTVELQGKAEATKAKWTQETIKAQAVTRAEQEKEVATLDAQRELDVARLAKEGAKEYKEKLILEGQGEAEKKRLIMAADGALKEKLATYERVMQYQADAIAKRAVPSVVMSGANGESGSDSQVSGLLQMMSVKAAKDLSLDMGVRSDK